MEVIEKWTVRQMPVEIVGMLRDPQPSLPSMESLVFIPDIVDRSMDLLWNALLGSPIAL